MRGWRKLGYRAFAALLCLSFVAGSVLAAAVHSPANVAKLQEHSAMIGEHGHSHVLEENLYWVLHGHSHEAANHDHSHAVLAHGAEDERFPGHKLAWRLRPSPEGPSRIFRIERPPRT